MLVGRLIGWIVLVIGLVIAGRDLLGWLDTSRFSPLSLGELWGDLGGGSLAATHRLVAGSLPGMVWDPGVTTLLGWSAAAAFLLLGALVLLVSRRGDDRLPRRRWR